MLSELTSDFAYSFLIAADGTATVEWVTDAFTRIIGYSAREWQNIGGWRGIAHPDDLPIIERRSEELFAGRQQVDEFRVVTRAGLTRWLRVFSRPEQASMGRIVRIIGAGQDITERREAEDVKTMFLATASHELKTPLTVIQGFAETLQVRSPTEGLEAEALSAIVRRSRELNKIVDRILLSSRIETGRAQVQSANVSLTPILSERVKALGAATGRTVGASIAPDLVGFVDPDAFVSVVDHLLDNAVKYSPGGSPIDVTAAMNDTHVIVTVTDRGIGMTAEQLEHCFEKFWQAEANDSRRFGGTGIGLYIVLSLVEAMGGRMNVESELGKGSTFTATFPGARDEDTTETVDVRKPGEGEKSVIKEFMRLIGVPGRQSI